MTTASVYRKSARPARREPEAPPKEYVYATVDRTPGLSMATWIGYFGFPAGAAVLLAAFLHPYAGLAGFVGTSILSYRRFRDRNSKKATEGAVLVVEKGELRIELMNQSQTGARMRLANVLNVELEHRKVQRLQEAGPIPGLRLANATVADAIDHARVVVITKKRRVGLTQSFFSNTEAVESLGQIRCFLRKHGWVPEDECEDEATDDVASDFGEEEAPISVAPPSP